MSTVELLSMSTISTLKTKLDTSLLESSLHSKNATGFGGIMERFKNVFMMGIIGLLILPSKSYGESSDFDSKVIAVESMEGESEASIHEAERLKQELAKERAAEQSAQEELQRQIDIAQKKKVEADQVIARSENDIKILKQKMDAAKNRTQKVKNEILVIRDQKNAAIQELKNTQAQKLRLDQELKDNQRTLRDIRIDQRKTIAKFKRLNSKVNVMTKDLVQQKSKVVKAYKARKKMKVDIGDVISKQRAKIEQMSKVLDQLEMAVEVDQAYDQKLAELGLKNKNAGRTVSSLNPKMMASVPSTGFRPKNREFLIRSPPASSLKSKSITAPGTP